MRVLQPIYFYKKQLLIAGFASLGFLLLLNIFAVAGKNSAKATGQGNKILTVFESGQKTSFKTNAKTVREALKAQKINFSKEDSVEPGLDEELTGAEYSINIYRAKPVVIEDGELKTKILTAAQTPRQIAEKAGLNVHNEDKLAFEESGNILEDGSINTLKITRAKEISVDLFGKTESFRTQAKTVEDFLKEKKIVLGKDDGISIDLKTQIANGLNFRIWRNGKQTLTVEEPTDFQTETIQDANKDSGYKEIKEAGEKGTKSVTYEVEMQNGKEISRKKINETEIKAAKKQVVIVGTKTSLPAGSHTDWMSAAGIPAKDQGIANAIISQESGWQVTIMNKSSGAYGIPQALPGSKMASAGADWQTNPITQLKWMNSYVIGRYKSWQAAYEFKNRTGGY
jgi:transglycosylase-like protein